MPKQVAVNCLYVVDKTDDGGRESVVNTDRRLSSADDSQHPVLYTAVRAIGDWA